MVTIGADLIPIAEKKRTNKEYLSQAVGSPHYPIPIERGDGVCGVEEMR
jgi:hypothetical protein